MGNKRSIFILMLVFAGAVSLAPAQAQSTGQEAISDADLAVAPSTEPAETSPASAPPKKSEPRITVKIYDSNPPKPEELALRKKKIQEAYRRAESQKTRRMSLGQKKNAIPVDGE